jgi:hypothetical protein
MLKGHRAVQLEKNSSEKTAVGHVNKRPLLREASFDDYDEIAAVGQANNLPSECRERWLHLWKSNPAYHHVPDWPIGWVLEDSNGRIVGSLLNVPCLYRFAGQTYVGGFGRGWAVNVEYRAFSLMLIMRQVRERKLDLCLTSTAGQKTSAVLRMYGWSKVPAGQWDRSALWITSYAQTVGCYLKAKTPKVVSALAGPLLYLPLSVKDLISARPRGFKTSYELGWCKDFDAKFDRFWAELECQKSRVLLGVRDSQTLKWHFKYLLDEDRIWIITAVEGQRLLAYAILERRDAQSLGLTRMLLVDFQTLADDKNLTSAMMFFALDRCRAEGIHIVENFGCWLEKEQRVVPRATYHRTLAAWTYWYRATNSLLSEELNNVESWYPTQYDTDASL